MLRIGVAQFGRKVYERRGSSEEPRIPHSVRLFTLLLAVYLGHGADLSRVLNALVSLGIDLRERGASEKPSGAPLPVACF